MSELNDEVVTVVVTYGATPESPLAGTTIRLKVFSPLARLMVNYHYDSIGISACRPYLGSDAKDQPFSIDLSSASAVYVEDPVA